MNPILQGIVARRRLSSLITGLEVYYPLSEASGSRYDVVNTSHLTDYNTVTSTTGKTGNAALFTRANAERLAVDSNSHLTTGDIDFTWAWWMKPTGTVSSVQGVINKWYDNSEREYCIYLSVFATNKLSFIVRNAANTNDYWITHSTSLSADTWYFVMAWHDSVNNLLGMSINNGTPQTIAHAYGVYNGAVNPRELAVGCDQNLPNLGNNSYFNGAMEEVGMWKRLLTSNEKAALYNSGNGTTYPFA